MTDRTKAVDRASKLQAQMESEQSLGNEAAAQAFAAAMSRLVLEHEINQDEIERHRLAGTTPPEEPIVERVVDLRKLGIAPRAKRNANLETLAGIVGRAHLCKILIRPRSNTIWFVGTSKHNDVSEYMLATLWRALVKMSAAGKRAARKADLTQNLKNYGGTFRQQFIFALDTRYQEERAAIVAETATAAEPELDEDGETVNTNVGLMRLDKAMQRVNAHIDARYGKKRSRAVYGRSGRWNEAGARDGRAAAARVNLRANGITASGGSRLGLTA
jgi:hypothetical protein